MAKKIFLILLIAILLLGIATISAPATRAESLNPDIITDKIIILDPTITTFLRQGTLSIVSFKSGNVIGFQVGNSCTTNLIVILDKPLGAQITQPVALVLRNKMLEIYLAPINIVAFEWSTLSIAEIPHSYFPLLITAQIVDFKKVGSEKEVNYCYCCNPPVTKIRYDYKLYLNTDTNPYESPKNKKYNVIMHVIVPEENATDLEMAAQNGDYIWIGISALNAEANTPYAETKVYLWLH